jgi:signal transduction histidine kinase
MPEVEPSALDAVLIGTVEYFRARLPRRGGSVTIDMHCEPLPPVAINRELLSWAFENIVKNAVDAVDGHHGRIEVSAGLAQDGRHVRIDFRDNGRGMSVKDQKYIFEPGRTTKQHGWGLGLTLARRIVEEYHDGHIFVFDSKRDVGTTIEVLLPIHSAA